MVIKNSLDESTIKIIGKYSPHFNSNVFLLFADLMDIKGLAT